MRILHTSDWHLGQFFYGKSRYQEHKGFLDWLLQQVESQKIDAVIVAGDIFDTGSPPSYARELYFDFIAQMAKVNCQLVILAGNHDSVSMLGESQSLLVKFNTYVITTAANEQESAVITLPNKNGEAGIVVCAIPFIRPRDVIKSKAGQSATEKQKSLQLAIADYYQSLFQRAKKVADEHQIPVVMTGHLTTVGASTSDSVREIYIGTLDAFPANHFPKADYIALGHIHQSQCVAKSDHIRYSGSPIPLSFDEAKQEKSVLVAEFDQAKLKSVESVIIPRFQPMALIKGKLAKLASLVEPFIAELDNEQTLWLDIELEDLKLSTNMQAVIAESLKEMPVEILLVRRSKESRQKRLAEQQDITLAELTADEVFEACLKQADIPADNEQHKPLKGLFAEIRHDLETKANSEQS